MIGVPPFFYEFLEHVQNGGRPEDFRPAILGGSVSRTSNDFDRSTPRKTSTRKKGFRTSDIANVAPKKKRKISNYQKVFGKHLKALKKKHPRTNISVLMKKAHRLTRKELK